MRVGHRSCLSTFNCTPDPPFPPLCVGPPTLGYFVVPPLLPVAAEREQISRGVAAEQSIRAIARALHRPASTISREVARNGGRAHYRAVDR